MAALSAPVISPDQYRRFGATDLCVSPLGFGGAPIGLLETEHEAVATILNPLLDHGVNVIDTAAMYYGSEEAIGKAIGHRRDEYVLITKCGHAEDAFDDRAWSPALIRQSIDRSLQRLRTDHVDVCLLHTCDGSVLEQGDAIGAVLEAKSAGKVRHAGFSGDNETAAFAMSLDGIDVLQTSLNICDQVNIDAALPTARSNDIGVMVKRPLANAAWKSVDEQYERYRNYAQPYVERFADMQLDMNDFSDNDWARVAMRFVLALDGAHTAIIGTTRADHVAANLAAVAAGPLPAGEVARIRSAFEKARADRDWPGLT